MQLLKEAQKMVENTEITNLQQLKQEGIIWYQNQTII